MPLVRIKSNRFGEGWKVGDIVGMDDEAARVPLENGEAELVIDGFKEAKAPEKIEEPEVLTTEQDLKKLENPYVCGHCQKSYQSKAGLVAHLKKHA